MHTILSFFRQSYLNPNSASVEESTFFSTFFWAIFLLIAVAAPPMWFLYFSPIKEKKTIAKMNSTAMTFEDDDFEYSFELQIQEALLVSVSPAMSYPSSADIHERVPSSPDETEIHHHLKENDTETESFCEICLENKRNWQMFRNKSCTHSFCCQCTSKHIEARIQENVQTIRCPGTNCLNTLNIDACRRMIPNDVLSRWEVLLCISSVPDSQKLFCPFLDCSAMVINDSGQVIREIECPECHRLFCAQCLVPWHTDFTCKEFQKLNAKKGKRDELMLKSLIKKKKWQKCPSCKMHVEKSEGCLHITCRCGYQFCYRCGLKWSLIHVCRRS